MNPAPLDDLALGRASGSSPPTYPAGGDRHTDETGPAAVRHRHNRRSAAGHPAAAPAAQPSDNLGSTGLPATLPGSHRTQRSALSLPDLAALPPTVGVEDAGRILGCGRSLAYDLVRRGEFPCRVIRLGNRYLVPTADLLTTLGIEPGAIVGAGTDPGDSGQPAGSSPR